MCDHPMRNGFSAHSYTGPFIRRTEENICVELAQLVEQETLERRNDCDWYLPQFLKVGKEELEIRKCDQVFHEMTLSVSTIGVPKPVVPIAHAWG